jgi:putative (di)nucleoside polyphosphate hydrolase
VVNFKRQVYERALRQFAPLVESLLSVQVGELPQRGEHDSDDRPRKGWAAA